MAIFITPVKYFVGHPRFRKWKPVAMSKDLLSDWIKVTGHERANSKECRVFLQHEKEFVVCSGLMSLSTIFQSSQRCLVAAGSSMLTFIVLPHRSIMPQTLDMISHPVTLSRHWVDQS